MANWVKATARRVVPDEIIERVKRRSMQRSLARFPAHDVRREYGGYELNVFIADPIAQEWYEGPWGQLTEIELLKTSRLRTDARVFDLGAHQAVWAMVMRSIVGPGGQVVALEPDAHNAAVARRNCASNDMADIVILEAVAARAPGEIPFVQGFNGSVATETTRGVMLPAMSVDELAGTYGEPDVIFMDVEGFEHEVMGGAIKTMKSIPDWFIEVHVQAGLEDHGGTWADITTPLLDAGYELLIGNEARAFVPFDESSTLLQNRFFLIALASSHKADSSG